MKCKNCPKCGNLLSPLMSRLEYDAQADRMNDKCLYCGYKWTELPHDHRYWKANHGDNGSWVLAIIGCLLAGYGLYNFLMVIASLLT